MKEEEGNVTEEATSPILRKETPGYWWNGRRVTWKDGKLVLKDNKLSTSDDNVKGTTQKQGT